MQNSLIYTKHSSQLLSLCFPDLLNRRLLSKTPHSPFALDTLPEDLLDDNVLTHILDLTSARHHGTIRSEAGKLLLGVYPHNSLSDARLFNAQTCGAVGHDLWALSVLHHLPLPGLALWSSCDSCNKGIVQALAADAFQCYDVLVSECGIHGVVECLCGWLGGAVVDLEAVFAVLDLEDDHDEDILETALDLMVAEGSVGLGEERWDVVTGWGDEGI